VIILAGRWKKHFKCAARPKAAANVQPTPTAIAIAIEKANEVFMIGLIACGGGGVSQGLLCHVRCRLATCIYVLTGTAGDLWHNKF